MPIKWQNEGANGDSLAPEPGLTVTAAAPIVVEEAVCVRNTPPFPAMQD